MKSYRINTKESVIENKFTSYISRLVALNDFKVFIAFENKTWQYWNLAQPEIEQLAEGQLPDKNSIMRYPDCKDICAITNTRIAFYDKKLNNFSVIDLEEKGILPNFTSPLPTLLALPQNERQEEQKMQNMKEVNTDFMGLIESGILVVLERKHGNNTEDNIITVFREDKLQNPAQTVFSSANRPCQMYKINEVDTILVSASNWCDSQIQFNIWNVNSNIGAKTYTIQENISCTIIEITNYGYNNICFWINVEQSGKPEKGIVDISAFLNLNQQGNNNENQPEQLTLQMKKEGINTYQDQDWILGGIFYFNYENGKMLINTISTESTIDLINARTQKKMFTFDQELKEFKFSLDGKYFINFDQENENFEEQNEEEESSEIILNVHSIIGLRSSLAYILENKQIIEQYGNNVASEIIDMIAGNLEKV